VTPTDEWYATVARGRAAQWWFRWNRTWFQVGVWYAESKFGPWSR
jgi:hypothetical protein